MPPAPRFVVYGAGAVGGVVGARLAEHGHDVALIARGAHARAMAADGLRLESPSGSTTVHVPVHTAPAELSWSGTEVVLLAVKSQDSVAALDELMAAAPASTPVVCLQNGVFNERAALRRFPAVYGVCAMCPAG